MEDYWLCHLTRHGHIADSARIRAADDSAAVTQAERFADGRAMELWNGGRRVRAWATSTDGEELRS